MLTNTVLEHILKTIPHLRVAVLGDLFLDRYLDIDPHLTEPSLETSLDAYQVVGVRSYPGAAGTVINNLCALGVKEVIPISIIGDDGEGYELRQALLNLNVVNLENVHSTKERRTPTYTKPLMQPKASNELPRELNRLDIKNRSPLPLALENQLLASLVKIGGGIDVMLVLDQVSETDCGDLIQD